MAPDGATIVAWTDNPEALSLVPPKLPSHLLAAVRPPGGERFGPPETVSTDGADAIFPAAAFDPVVGVPVLVWGEGRPDAALVHHTASRAP